MGFCDGSGISWIKRKQSNLHLVPERQPHQHLITERLQIGRSS